MCFWTNKCVLPCLSHSFKVSKCRTSTTRLWCLYCYECLYFSPPFNLTLAGCWVGTVLSLTDHKAVFKKQLLHQHMHPAYFQYKDGYEASQYKCVNRTKCHREESISVRYLLLQHAPCLLPALQAHSPHRCSLSCEQQAHDANITPTTFSIWPWTMVQYQIRLGSLPAL